MKQYEAILHFMVAVPPDTEGAVMSHGMKGNITPAMVRAGIGGSEIGRASCRERV